jgi:hypothetical protein
MSEMNAESLESALGSAFGDAPEAKAPAPKAPAPKAPQAPRQAAPVEEPEELVLEEDLEIPGIDPAELLDEAPEEEQPEAVAAEPVYEIEVDGKPETITGTERVKELITRGLKAGRGFEENARVREALQLQAQQSEMGRQFQMAVSQDIATLQTLDQQLQAYAKLDWNAAYDINHIEALKLKEQRDQLREQRAAAIGNLNAKQQQFQATFSENSQRLLAAEYDALLAKVPAWRNQEKANAGTRRDCECVDGPLRLYAGRSRKSSHGPPNHVGGPRRGGLSQVARQQGCKGQAGPPSTGYREARCCGCTPQRACRVQQGQRKDQGTRHQRKPPRAGATGYEPLRARLQVR